MKKFKTIGDYYAHVLQSQLNTALQAKLDSTSGFKKTLAGIFTLDDAKRKGYAPSDEQIKQLKSCIKKHANAKYAHHHFQCLAANAAALELADSVSKDLAALNEQWHKDKQFYFDKGGLKDLTEEATALIGKEHTASVQHFFG